MYQIKENKAIYIPAKSRVHITTKPSKLKRFISKSMERKKPLYVVTY